MKQINREAKKLYENIVKYSNSNIASKIAFGMELPFSPIQAEKNEWVKYIISGLEKEFDEQTIKNIRMGCYCNGDGHLDESKKFIKSIYDDSASIEEFVDKMNEHGVGLYLKDEDLFIKYSSCPCQMIESVTVLPTKTWCYCTVGYNKAIFEYVLDCKVDIELLESIKMGNKQCVMKIIPLSKNNINV